MNYTLELIVVPVSDVDAAKAFYVDRLGFELIVDHQPNEHFRIVQANPPGSSCAIAFGTGLGDQMAPGSLHGLHLVVSDIVAAREELAGRGVEISEPYHYGMDASRNPGVEPSRAPYATFADFKDPDGNTWLVQDVSTRA